MNYVQLPGEEHLDMALTWSVADAACRHLGGTLDLLFRYGVRDKFPNKKWESLWLIVGPPLSKDLAELELWLEALDKQAPQT